MLKQIKKNRGQAIIEFALILPLFIFMLCAFAYLAMFFHDYLTLTDMTRDIARRQSVGISLESIKKEYKGQVFLTDFYVFDPNTGIQITPMPKDTTNTSAGSAVKVTLTATLQASDGSYWKEVLPATISSSLVMYKEG